MLSVESVRFSAGDAILDGDLSLPENARGIVVFAHGSGSSRHSSRNRAVAAHLQNAGLATLLMDLLTRDEEAVDLQTRHLRFDIPLLAARVASALDWLQSEKRTATLAVGLFGASTGAAAALIAAAQKPTRVGAVVSRGGRPDLAGEFLPRVEAPTLLLVGAHDEGVIELNQEAQTRLNCASELILVPRATHLFEEPGTLEEVSERAARWFAEHLVNADEFVE